MTRPLSYLRFLMATLLLASCSEQPPPAIHAASNTAFIGSTTCKGCHTQQYDDWQISHHAAAMQSATERTVLGDFSDKVFEYFDTSTQFTRQADAFIVRTENGAGELQDFRITHTFGVEPLQQYLVEFQGGRKQALPFLWDARSHDAGGQRWYHLYPDEPINHDDPLHWTGRFFNWNYMCAECHSTNVDMGYDEASDSFNTTFEEISVGCESCHGPGSQHVLQASKNTFDNDYGLPVDLDDRSGTQWQMNPTSGIAELSAPTDRQQQPESCGRCHARRSMLAKDYEYGRLLTDTHMPALLEEDLYHADGRILEEVYVYGSFLQSKMYAAGVTCSDCHNPHSGRLETGDDPNAVCATCHLPAKFATSQHSGSDTLACVDCHMPATTYMGIDDRRDHSFRIPAAGLRPTHYGQAIAAARAGPANAQIVKAFGNTNTPAIAQGTLLTLLTPQPDPDVLALLVDGLTHADSLVRIGALRALRQFPPQLRLRDGRALLSDPVRGVRIEAALTFAGLRDQLGTSDASAFDAAANEYRESAALASSMPQTLIQLAEFESRCGNSADAGKRFQQALEIDPQFAPTHHAYGLWLVREGQTVAAIDALRQATKLAPDNERFIYVYGVALNSTGQTAAALATLEDATTRFPDNYNIAWGLATMLRDNAEPRKAQDVAQRMLERYPGDENFSALLESLKD